MKNTKRYKVKCWIPFKMIEESFEEKWESSLLFFCTLKSVFKNPTFYDYNYSKIGRLIGYSSPQVKKHIEVLKSKGLAFERDNNLCLIGTNKLKQSNKGYKFIVPIEFHENRGDHMTALQFSVIKRKIDQQKVEINKIVEIILLHGGLLEDYSKDDLRRVIKRRDDILAESKNKNFKFERLLNNFTTLSNESIGELFNRTQLSGLTIQKNLNRLGYIRSFQRISVLGKKMSKEEFAVAKAYGGLDDSIQLGNNGELFEQLSNLIILSEDIEGSVKTHIKNLYDSCDDKYLIKFFEKDSKIIEGKVSEEFKNKRKEVKFIKFHKKQKKLEGVTSYINKIKTSLDNKKEVGLSKSQKALNTIIERYSDNPLKLGYILNKRNVFLEKWKYEKRIENINKMDKRLGITH